MNGAEVKSTNSFKITGRGLILDLRHFENGLPENTILISESSGLTWKITARVLFDHAVHEQRIFESESVEYLLIRFDCHEKELESINGIKNREGQNTFQYLLKPINQEQKPENGENLKINYPEQNL